MGHLHCCPDPSLRLGIFGSPVHALVEVPAQTLYLQFASCVRRPRVLGRVRVGFCLYETPLWEMVGRKQGCQVRHAAPIAALQMTGCAEYALWEIKKERIDISLHVVCGRSNVAKSCVALAGENKQPSGTPGVAFFVQALSKDPLTLPTALHPGRYLSAHEKRVGAQVTAASQSSREPADSTS